MKKLIIIAVVAILSCNDPKDPPDDNSISTEQPAPKADTVLKVEPLPVN